MLEQFGVPPSGASDGKFFIISLTLLNDFKTSDLALAGSGNPARLQLLKARCDLIKRTIEWPLKLFALNKGANFQLVAIHTRI